MARFRVVTKYQVSGWRFLFRRIEHALVRRDASMIDDPQRGRSTALAIGIALACVAVAGSAVLAYFKPDKAVGNAKIVSDKDSGAVYVHLGGRLYPALNLTSARLIAGEPAAPVPVTPDELAKYPRGPIVGIVGAPGTIAEGSQRDSTWAVCDAAQTGASAPIDQRTGLPTLAASDVQTTVIGTPLTIDGDATRPLADREARLLRNGDATWLVYDSPDQGIVRASIDLGDSAVMLAVGIDASAQVLPASHGLIAAIPEVPALRVPKVGQAGASTTLTNGLTVPIGSVLTMTAPDRTVSYYVVTSAGVVRITQVLAAMLRNADSHGSVTTTTVGPDVIAANLRAGSLPGTQGYPARPLRLVDAGQFGVSCYGWSRTGSDANAITKLVVGRRLPLRTDEQKSATPLVTAPTSQGRTADLAYMPLDTGRFVQVTGMDPASPRRESLFWISDSGIRYGVQTDTDNTPGRTDPTLAALALHDPIVAPWNIVSLFAVGPTLSQEDARIQHDGVAPDKAAIGMSGGTS